MRSTIIDGAVEVHLAPTLGDSSAKAYAPAFAALARAMIATTHPDIVCLHMPNLSGMLATLALGRPYLVYWQAPVQARELAFSTRMLLPAYRFIEAFVLRRATRIIVTSRAMLEGCPQLAPHRDKCRIIPLGIDLPGEIPSCDNSLTPGQAPMVMSLGRFVPYKGFDRLVRAACLMPRTRFVMAGDGPLLGEIKKLAWDLGLAERIDFPGRIDDVKREALYAQCDVFCLPSVSPAESFGLVLLEAMSYAKPVVAACPDWSGIREVVAHQKTGLLVPPDAPLALARAISSLLANPDKAQTMGAMGQKRVRELYDIRVVAAQANQVYTQASLGQKSGRCKNRLQNSM